jgi:predicted choloylglycine hydrolase
MEDQEFQWMRLHSSSAGMAIHLRSVHEDTPGEKWKSLFDKLWPFYRKWYLREGAGKRAGYLTSVSHLEEYMPELMPVYHHLTQLVGNGDVESRYLSMWNPPPFMSGCSQVAWTRNNLALIRNYDYSPRLFDGIFLRTNWLQPVIGMLDSSWGLLDGINASGLSVSLTFGGRNVVGNGFGIPLVLRYVLEICRTTYEAIQVLCRVPVHMAYNITLLDSSGFYSTVYLSPDRPPLVTDSAIGTNHQVVVEWEDYARISATQERMIFLQQSMQDESLQQDTMIQRFLKPPLYNMQYEKMFGTLYTAVYHPAELRADVLWPGKKLEFSFGSFAEEHTIVTVSKIESRFTAG